MPNWCMTSYTIVGKASDVKRINDALKNHPVKEDSAKNWQGNILNALGVSYDDVDKHSMRGFLYEHDYIGETGDGDAQLKMLYEEAWCRTDFADVLQEVFPDISIYWMAEEPGCELYQTNDSDGNFYPDRYYVDTCINGEYESEYFTTEEAAYEWLSQRSDCKCADDVELFNESRQLADLEDFIYVHEFDIVN